MIRPIMKDVLFLKQKADIVCKVYTPIIIHLILNFHTPIDIYVLNVYNVYM